VFQASDTPGPKRREFIGAARDGGALLRDTDGFALTMVPLARLEAVTEIAQVAVAALLAVAVLGRGSARPADLGQLAWLAAFGEDDRRSDPAPGAYRPRVAARRPGSRPAAGRRMRGRRCASCGRACRLIHAMTSSEPSERIMLG